MLEFKNRFIRQKLLASSFFDLKSLYSKLIMFPLALNLHVDEK